MRVVDDTLVIVSGSVSAEAGPLVRKAPWRDPQHIIAEPCSPGTTAAVLLSEREDPSGCTRTGDDGLRRVGLRSLGPVSSCGQRGDRAGILRFAQEDITGPGFRGVEVQHPERSGSASPIRADRCGNHSVGGLVGVPGAASPRSWPSDGAAPPDARASGALFGEWDSGILSSWSGTPTPAQSGVARAGRWRSTTTGR
jgi:hypothetical protein